MTEATPGEQAAFDRGVISQTLTEYGQHLRDINGSTERTAVALAGLAHGMQDMGAELKSLRTRLDAEGETRIAMAAALKDAESARLAQAERKWNVPMQRVAWVIAALSGLLSLYLALR
jgi:membrane protease subunit (stomatin/prohibitin family)